MKEISLFTTTSSTAEKLCQLLHLVDSIEKSDEVFSRYNVNLYILFQNTNSVPEEFKRRWIQTRSFSGLLSLSAARNLLIREFLVETNYSGIVAFPDDDAWYPSGLLMSLVNLFSSDVELDFFFCRYGSVPEASGGRLATLLPNVQTVAKYASSNTIFMTHRVVKSSGYLFNEFLGVGAPFAGGEDTEYALRVYNNAFKTVFTDKMLIGHRDYNPQLGPKYYSGSLLALGLNATNGPCFFWIFLRKIAIGIYFIARRKIVFASLSKPILELIFNKNKVSQDAK